MYGSQTGNAESVAKDLSEKLNQDNIINKCMDLNSAKKIPLKDLAKCIIIICSTTGNKNIYIANTHIYQINNDDCYGSINTLSIL